MDSYRQSLKSEIPEELHPILSWDFIPWGLVKNRHGDCPNTPLIALMKAYIRLDEILDLKTLASMVISPDSGDCLRCGTCCIYMRPGAVSGRTYRRWLRLKVPVAIFYRPMGRKEPPTTYDCWYNDDERLRMCPFLLNNLYDRRPFCSIHHMGREYRPRTCSRFPPNPPLCQTGNFVPVP